MKNKHLSEQFQLVSDKTPKGDQPEAIAALVAGYNKHPLQVLLGITGSGKTFTIANVINTIHKPTLVLAHNKTLAFQLYDELKELFPHNKVAYFVSYFDYYQPESYMPATDTYIEKDSKVNAQIERMRLHATAGLLSRNDVIVVCSISCIYGIGSPTDWKQMSFVLKVGQNIKRDEFFHKLVELQYERNDTTIESGKFRVRGSTVDLFLGYEQHFCRINFVGDTIARIQELEHPSGAVLRAKQAIHIFPARHYVVPEDRIEVAVKSIRAELKREAPRLPELEQKRLVQRTNYDLEMIDEVGYCNGIENYSMHFEGRSIDKPPFCLLDFFPKDFLLVIDESHQTIPQSRAMYHGDRARKKNLVENGFRLPSAYGNRPLMFEEFEKYFTNAICVSATPGPYELDRSGQIVKQIVRPTGLLDPEVEIRPTEGQVDDLIGDIKNVIASNCRVLVTTLTKRMAEDLTEYLAKAGIMVRYLHSEIDSIQRIEIIRQLRLGTFDVLVGINLLREGLDIPEVSLVAILDADKEGFLRDERSLIQTIGRAARNENGRVVLYADKLTRSISAAVGITQERRKKQQGYNKEHGITPKTVYKKIAEPQAVVTTLKHVAKSQIPRMLKQLEEEMKQAADNLDFEKAMTLRDQLREIERRAKK